MLINNLVKPADVASYEILNCIVGHKWPTSRIYAVSSAEMKKMIFMFKLTAAEFLNKTRWFVNKNLDLNTTFALCFWLMRAGVTRALFLLPGPQTDSFLIKDSNVFWIFVQVFITFSAATSYCLC